MKRKNVITILTILFFTFLLTGIFSLVVSRNRRSLPEAAKTQDVYYCPMHPGFTSDNPGDCGICGMKMVKKESAGHLGQANTAAKERKILYYRNPMNPQVTSPVPMKDSMGMDYVPVYEQEAGPESGIYISPERQQVIGVKKETVQRRNLTLPILTVGKIAYNPELYVAQQEYLQALKTRKDLSASSLARQYDSLAGAAERKLLLLGMSEEQIKELANQNKPQENLYLPTNEDTVWVYITIYEYEIGLIKEGTPVEIESIAFPGEKFSGKITSITAVLDPVTRSVQARAEVDNVEHKLKPEMFVNAKAQVDLGEKLAVPDSAVLDTGVRKIVYVSKEGDVLEPREVTLGQKAEGYYEVIGGLSEGDIVVTSGNFLVDSESKLKGASQAQEQKHGQ